MKDVGERIGSLPSLGEHGLDVEVMIACQQRVEEQFVNALRLCIDTNPRIEVQRAALDDHHQGVRVGLVGAGTQQNNHRDTEAQREKVKNRRW